MSQDPTDLLDRDGAAGLARDIRCYWIARGYLVQCRLERCFEKTTINVWDVRSDMVDGLPRRRAC